MKKLLYVLAMFVAVAGIVMITRTHKTESDKVLVAYFSATGNTKSVAEKLANEINADLFEIKPEQVYTADDLNWRNDNSRSSVEMSDKNSRPAIALKIQDFAQYKTIFLGFPIWWGREPAIINTFMDAYNFSGKTVIPFATSGSTPNTDEAAANIQSLAPKARVLTGKRFPVDVSSKELKSWADGQM